MHNGFKGLLAGILVAIASGHPGYAQTTGTAAPTDKGSAPSSTDTYVARPRTPVYPDAIRGWDVPLGQRDRKPGSVINRFIVHHTTNTGDESPYFLRKNERGSCPTWYVMSNGDVIEFISPVKRPSSTGSANDYSVAVETQNTSRAPDWGISEEAHESIAHIAAWLSKQTNFGPYKVDIKLDRTHIIGHNEAGVNKTVCPGPSMRLDWIVERARQIAGGTADKATSQPVTVIPADRPKKARFSQRHAENLKRIKQGPIDLLFMGDSITDRWSSAPTVWNEAFGKWHPANFGVGGDRTENVIWRMNHGELDGISPKVMVLMIGTNNTHTSPAPDIVAGIKKIIEITHQKTPKTKILLLAVFPREPRIKNGVAQKMPPKKVREINKLLPKLADGDRVRFLDIGDQFLVNGKVPKDIMPDGLHPNEKGYKIWAKAITPVLAEMMQ